MIFDPKDPVYDAERFLMLDDVRIESDGSISPPSSMDGMMAGRYGNVLLTNGRPSKEVTATVEQGTVERWRIVNTANARTMVVGIEGASFRVIGTDGGLLAEPYTPKRLTVAIGQRYQIEVTYDQAGAVKLQSFPLVGSGEQEPRSFYDRAAIPWNATVNAMTMEIMESKTGAPRTKEELLSELDDFLAKVTPTY